MNVCSIVKGTGGLSLLKKKLDDSGQFCPSVQTGLALKLDFTLENSRMCFRTLIETSRVVFGIYSIFILMQNVREKQKNKPVEVKEHRAI